MKWAMCGLTVLAAVQFSSAQAAPNDSDVWIGFSDSDNGFLLDEDTGDAWMTGPCLKSLAKATKSGTVWISHTVELVSVGRAMAVLDQRFELDMNQTAPEVTVTSVGRGGPQSLPAILDRNCGSAGRCSDLVATQRACQG
ncbi:MAG: hypothetical protein ABNH53_12785 [Henriciella sp.]|jgi:hypothetical protein